MKLKITINYIFFVISILFWAIFLSEMFTKQNDAIEANLYQTIYNQKKNSVDVVFVGASTSKMSWNELLAYSKYGITSINCSAGSMPCIPLQYLIKEILKNQKPKVIIINIDPLIFSDYKNKYYLLCLHYMMKFSLNKLLLICSLYHYYNINIKDVMTVLFYIPVNKTYTNHLLDIFFHKLKDPNEIKNVFIPPKEIDDICLKAIYSLFKSIKKINTPVLFISSVYPNYFIDKKSFEDLDVFFNKFFKLAEEENFEFIDMNKENIIKEINLSIEDFSDNSHLNYYGAYKFTSYFSKILLNKYNLEDRRKDKDIYAFWKNSIEDFRNKVNKELNIDISI